MKIVQVVGSINPRIGGKERFVGELAKELLKLGHEVTIVTCDKNYEADLNCDMRYIHALNIINVPTIPSFKELLKQLDQNFDVCHLHYHAVFGEIVALVCKINGLPLITTIHDEMKRGIHKKIYDRMLLGTISHLSDRIICLTSGMKMALVRRGLIEEKVFIAPNAMHVRELQYQASKVKDDVQFDNGFDLLFVGRLEERKGVKYLLKALSILNKKRFRPILKIVGEGVHKYDLMSFVKENGLSSQVIFAGYIPQEELMKNYLSAGFVVIPSLYEGVPSVAIEALALGKPVITTLIAGMEAINSENLGFAVPPKDCDALANVIMKAFSLSDAELSRIKSKATTFVEQYDWNIVVNQIISQYEECVERN